MKALLLAVALLGLASLVPTDADAREDQSQIRRVVAEEALRRGFPPSLALAVADAASNFDPHLAGPEDRRGVMQVPNHIAQLLDGPQPDALWDPRQNIRFGLDYLERLIRARSGRVAAALAAYELGLIPEEAASAAEPAPSAFVNRVLRLRRHYRSEAQFWVEALKGESLNWELLRPDSPRLQRLARLARQLGLAKPRSRRAVAEGDSLERRRRAILPHLDDFSG